MLFDFLFVAIILLTFVVGYRKGAAETLLSLCAFFASIVLAVVVSRPISLLIYNTFIKGGLESRISGFVVESPAGSLVFETTAFLAELPGMFLNLLGKWNIIEHIGSDSAGVFASAEAASKGIADMISPVITGIISIIVCVLLFIIFRLVLGVVAKGLAKVFKMPLLKFPDSLLGGAVGLIKGVVFVIAILLLLELLQPFVYEKIEFVYSGLSGSVVARLIDDWKIMPFIDTMIYGK